MRELSVAEQRYEAVRAVIAEGETVTSVAARFGVARKTVHGWLAKYEAGGLEGELVLRPVADQDQPGLARQLAGLEGAEGFGKPRWAFVGQAVAAGLAAGAVECEGLGDHDGRFGAVGEGEDFIERAILDDEA